MKVYIGKFPSRVSIYDFEEWLIEKGVPKKFVNNVINFLEDTWVDKFLQWFDDLQSKKKRKIKIKIDEYDTWNLDDTLAIIIRPMLHKFAKYKHGAPFVDPEDVPQNMWPKWYINGNTYQEGERDETYFKRWNYIFTEIVWTFDVLNTDWECLFYKNISSHPHSFDIKGYEDYNNRIKKGLLMFGKYFRGLWT